MDDVKAEIKNLPGIKERDLRPCKVCGKRHEAPVFYRVQVESFAFDMQAVQRQVGLGMMMGGNAGIAQVMGPDEDMAKCLSSETAILCLDCATTMPVLGVIGE